MILNKNIKEYCKEEKSRLRQIIANSYKTPQLAIIQMGEVEASNRYVRNKIKDCEEVGIKADRYWFEEDTTEKELLSNIEDLCKSYDGVICQLPLPPHIDVKKVERAISPEADVDGFHPMSNFKPCTPLGIIEYLQACKFDFEGKKVTVIGRSDIVGKPLARMLVDLNATVTLCHSRTKELFQHLFNADLIIVAVGKEKFLNCYSLRMPIVDVGINFNSQGKLVGDCYNTEGRDVTPVPGGVGLLTRLALLENTCRASGLNVDEDLE